MLCYLQPPPFWGQDGQSFGAPPIPGLSLDLFAYSAEDSSQMHEAVPFKSRKRPWAGEVPPTPKDNEAFKTCKRIKRSPPREAQPEPQPAFWDNLSRVHLTKRALEELNRRNTQESAIPRLASQELRRPITRRTVARLSSSHHPFHLAADFIAGCGRNTLKELKQFARLGGPDLSDVRGFRLPGDCLRQVMQSVQSLGKRAAPVLSPDAEPASKSSTARSSGPYDRNFLQNLVDHGIYPNKYEYPDRRIPPKPANWDEIRQRLIRRRPSLSPSRFSEGDFDDFVRADAHASKEQQVQITVIPTIEGHVEDNKCVSGGVPFTNLEHLTDGTLVSSKPDLFYGARPEQLDRGVRNELGSLIIPSTQHDLPIAPNFFLAAKGPDGILAVAGRQACYDGALGARGILKLHSYGRQEPAYNNKAYTITSIYHGGVLRLYTCYPRRPAKAGDRPEYYMHQLRVFSLIDEDETFRQGAAAYRNIRDWAKEQRDEAIRQANERANRGQEREKAHDTEGTNDDDDDRNDDHNELNI